MKKILVIAYLEKNFGDDLFLKLLFERYSNVTWILDGNEKEYKNIFEKYNNVHILKNYKNKIFSKFGIGYFKYDAVIYIGGSIFIQHNYWKRQLKQRKNVFRAFRNKPKFILGSNFGPFKETEFLEKYTNLLNECEDVCVRDTYSYELFNKLNNIRLAPDIVFQLSDRHLKKKKNSIGISLINLEGRSDLEQYNKVYRAKIIELIENLIKNGKYITLFSFCEKEGDLEVIKYIANNIKTFYKKNIKILNYTGDIDNFLSEFESMENIIGTRFHSCILSQVFDQGLYPLIYSNKTYNMLHDIGLNNEYTYIKDIENLDVNHVLNIINNNKISNKNIFEESERQFEVLDKYVFNN